MFDDGLVYLNLSLLMEKILGSFWIPAITILQLWRDLPLQFTYSETCHFLRLLGVWPTVKPHTCTYLLYGQKHPCCFSLPPLTDVWAPHISFSFNLQPSSSFSLLSLRRPTRGSDGGAVDGRTASDEMGGACGHRKGGCEPNPPCGTR